MAVLIKPNINTPSKIAIFLRDFTILSEYGPKFFAKKLRKWLAGISVNLLILN